MTTAQEFAQTAKANGWTVELHQRRCPYTNKIQTGSGCVTIQRTFPADDAPAYRTAERDAHNLIGLAHIVSYGSTWGTDSSSVGGHAGLTGGYMRLSKSGVGTRWMTQAAKALGTKVDER